MPGRIIQPQRPTVHKLRDQPRQRSDPDTARRTTAPAVRDGQRMGTSMKTDVLISTISFVDSGFGDNDTKKVMAVPGYRTSVNACLHPTRTRSCPTPTELTPCTPPQAHIMKGSLCPTSFPKTAHGQKRTVLWSYTAADTDSQEPHTYRKPGLGLTKGSPVQVRQRTVAVGIGRRLIDFLRGGSSKKGAVVLAHTKTTPWPGVFTTLSSAPTASSATPSLSITALHSPASCGEASSVTWCLAGYWQKAQPPARRELGRSHEPGKVFFSRFR